MSPNKDINKETDGSISPTTIISSDKSLNSFKNNNNIIATKFTLTEFPDKNLIKNIGLDHTGVHSHEEGL